MRGHRALSPLHLLLVFFSIAGIAAAGNINDPPTIPAMDPGKESKGIGCDLFRGELRPELQHPYSAAELDGIVKHIKMRLSDLKAQGESRRYRVGPSLLKKEVIFPTSATRGRNRANKKGHKVLSM